MIGPLLFLVYINVLTDNISSNMKLFAGNSSLFTRVTNVTDSEQIYVEITLTSIFTKQSVEVIFTVEPNNPVHPELYFNDIPVARKVFTNNLGLYLDDHLSFDKNVRKSIIKAKAKGHICSEILLYQEKHFCIKRHTWHDTQTVHSPSPRLWRYYIP